MVPKPKPPRGHATCCKWSGGGFRRSSQRLFRTRFDPRNVFQVEPNGRGRCRAVYLRLHHDDGDTASHGAAVCDAGLLSALRRLRRQFWRGAVGLCCGYLNHGRAVQPVRLGAACKSAKRSGGKRDKEKADMPGRTEPSDGSKLAPDQGRCASQGCCNRPCQGITAHHRSGSPLSVAPAALRVQMCYIS